MKERPIPDRKTMYEVIYKYHRAVLLNATPGDTTGQKGAQKHTAVLN